MACLGVAATVLAAPAFSADGKAPEYAVKANFLYKFGDFVAWPEGVFASPTAPVNICVAGDDPFGKLLDEAVAGTHIDRRDIVLHRLGEGGTAPCQILYVRGPMAADVLKANAGKPVLTITDAAPEDAKGVINFVLKDNRVRFEIDERTANAIGLNISSKLLSLAISVRR
jgi:hypothetical protein